MELSTQTVARRQPTEKPQDPRGSNGASIGTDPEAVPAPTHAKQSAESATADDEMSGDVPENVVNMRFIGSLELAESDRDFVSELLLTQLGSCGRRYRREAQKVGRKIISDMYSPPRVAA